MNQTRIINFLKNTEYEWLVKDVKIEKVIYIFSQFLKNSSNKIHISWYRVIVLWLKGLILDITSEDLYIIKHNPKPIFFKYNEEEIIYYIYIFDILKLKIGKEKYSLFEIWLDDKLQTFV